MTQAQEQERPFYYHDMCYGIAPILVRSRRDFVAGQIVVLAAALVVLLLAV
jgi:hypothetical protein